MSSDTEMSYDRLKFWPALSRASGKTILKKIARSWVRLLDDPKASERDCLAFLSENAGFFFRERLRSWTIAVSEVRLGADYRADFMQPSEGQSRGPAYTLIELESPNQAPYDSRGYPTRRLSDAIQQILDWRSWITTHRTEAMDLFPSAAWHHTGTANFKYQIIIGRRKQAERYRDKLNRAADQNGVEIRSFDYLTDIMDGIIHGHFSLHCDRGLSHQLSRLSKETTNRLANPFVRSLKDVDWRYATRSVRDGWMHHLIPVIAESVVGRLESSPSLAEFDHMWSTLAKAEKDRLYEDYKSYFPD